MKTRVRSALGIGLQASDLTSGTTGEPGLFLGRFGLGDLRRELAEAGVLAALHARGYPDPRIHIEATGGEHRLTVAPAEGEESLVDLRMSEGTLPVTEPALRARGVEILSALVVNWLALQDPRASFTAERPRLPGQTHPGLGLGRHIYTRVLGWAAAWGKDALINVPAYFHNARFYAPPFSFLSAAEQGRFEALVRDLGPLTVAAASAAVDEGRVVEEPSGQVVRWTPGDMLAPLSAAVREYVSSPEYRGAAAAARERRRFRLS